MIEINLVPDVKQELIKAQRVRSTVISFSIAIGIIVIGIVTLLSVYTYGVQTLRSTAADTAIKEGSDKLNNVVDLSKTLTIQNQLTKISAIHANTKIDSRIFDILIAIIPPSPNDIKISSLVVDSSTGSIVIEGQATNSYAAVEVFKKTIEGAKVKFKLDTADKDVALASNVSTSNTSYGEDSTGTKVLRFNLSFNYAPEVFSPLSTDVTVVIANGGNATDSYLGVPKSIFVDKAKDLGTGN
jgi:hypothetical protein